MSREPWPYLVDVGPCDRRELRLDLRSPCNDCPFLLATPCHEGIASGLADYVWDLERGTFRHTCHKTDPRADSAEGKRNLTGPLQHCAGSMIAALRSGTTTNLMDDAEARGLLKLRRLNLKAPVGTFLELVRKYEPWARAKLAEAKP